MGNRSRKTIQIIENQIYISELQSKNMFLFLMIFDPENKYKLNFFRGNFLSKEFDEHMKNVWKLDKFDRCVENPPFQRRFDLKVLDKCLNICEQINFVHPASWIIDQKNVKGDFTKLKEKIKDNLKNIILFNGNSIFNIALFIPCCITYIDLNNKYNDIEIFDKINDIRIKYTNINDINKFSNIKEYTSIKEKLKSNRKISNIYNVDNKYPFYVNMSRIRGHVNQKDESNMLKNDFYTTVTKEEKIDTKITKSVFFNFKTEKESNNFLNYLKTYFSRFCLSLNKNGSDLNKIDFNQIPWLDFSKEWTDDKLYKHFELTEEEIRFIEKHIPKYY